MITREDLGRFLDACRGAIVMIDEAYWGFGSTDNSYVKSYIDEYPNLLICRTFSKYFAMAGCRIGFSFAGNNLEGLKGYTTRYLGYNLISEKLYSEKIQCWFCLGRARRNERRGRKPGHS